MTRDVEAIVLVLVGLFMGRVVLEGAYLWYVKEGLRLPLLASVAVLLLVGLASIRSRHEEAEIVEEPHPTIGEVLSPLSADGHEHHHGPGRIGYLLLAPVAVLMLIAPSPLGSFAAERAATNTVATPLDIEYPALPEARDGASDVTLYEILARTSSTIDGKLAGNPVRLVGFVVPDDELTDGYRLTRFTLGCCASDASAIAVAIVGSDLAPEADEWQEVVAVWDGEFHDAPDGRLPLLELRSARVIDEPAQPYE